MSGRCSRHQLLGHRCQLLVGLAHQQVPHFAGNNGYLGIIAWRGASHDGDGRCLRRRRPAVAFMQYVRVVMVALVASIIARFWVHAPRLRPLRLRSGVCAIHALLFLKTLVLVLGGVILGPVSRFRQEYC